MNIRDQLILRVVLSPKVLEFSASQSDACKGITLHRHLQLRNRKKEKSAKLFAGTII